MQHLCGKKFFSTKWPEDRLACSCSVVQILLGCLQWGSTIHNFIFKTECNKLDGC